MKGKTWIQGVVASMTLLMWGAFIPEAVAGSADNDPNSAFFSPTTGGPILPLWLPPLPRPGFLDRGPARRRPSYTPESPAPEPDRVVSAVVVGTYGPVLTDADALNGCDHLRLALPDGKSLSAHAIQVNPILDVALVAADLQGGVPIRIRSAPFNREQVWMMGYNGASPHLRIRSGPASLLRSEQEFSLPASIEYPPNGAVFDGNGDLVGWASRGPSGGIRATDGAALDQFLQSQGIHTLTADGLASPSIQTLHDAPDRVVLRLGCFLHP